jgi:hypothetical protein
MTLAYDQTLSIKYFGTFMRPLWAKEAGAAADAMLVAAEAGYEDDLGGSAAYDGRLEGLLEAKGGEKYATMGALVHRQVHSGWYGGQRIVVLCCAQRVVVVLCCAQRALVHHHVDSGVRGGTSEQLSVHAMRSG